LPTPLEDVINNMKTIEALVSLADRWYWVKIDFSICK
jgi:hypothetical protein